MSDNQLSLSFEAIPQSTPALPDQEARDRAQNDIVTSFVVSAGAGAGKTETLIRRLERALQSGCDPASLVAITFTDRAARDLVNKLRVKLPPDLLPTIERMSVGTIHSFCLSILRRHPLEAGLPPVFATQDELLSGTDAADRAHRVRNAFFDAVAERDDPALRQAVDVLVAVNGMYHFDVLIGLIDQQWDRFDELELVIPAQWQEPCRIALKRVTAMAHDPAVALKLREKLLDMQPDIDAFLACDSMAAALACMPSASKLGNNGGTAAKPDRDEVKLQIATLPTLINDCALRHVLQVLVPLVLHEARARYQSGSVSFDDILVLTRRLLDRRPALRARLRGEINHLCVDEFQDTDVVQYDIVQALTEPIDSAHTPVLFAVGDPKQSIYGFREAEVGLFEQLRHLPHVTSLQLSTNFRSRPGVLHWVNTVFEHWFEADAAKGQVPFSPLLGHVPEAPVNVTVIGDEFDAAADVAAQAQADDIARVVVTAHGSWVCRVGGGDRPARYTDVAVLVRTRADLTYLEPAFRRAGIPYVIEGGALLYDTRETRDLLRVLTAVNDTASPITVVNALRTSVLAISDVELLQHTRAGGSWNLYADSADADPPGHPAVLLAMAQLRRWSEARHRVPVPELLAEIARDTWSHAASLLDGTHTTTWRRLRLVHDEARWWFEQTGGSLGEYLRWVAMRVENDDRSNVTTNETDEDAVHVLTVHAAKGLEFPIVVAAGLGRKRPGGDTVRATFNTSADGVRTAAVKMGRIATDDFTTGNETNLAMLEAARLAYVACTRARDHLVVCLHHGRRAKPNSAAELMPHLPADDGGLTEYEATTLVARPPVSELSDHVDRPDHRRTEWRVRSSWSATQLRHADDDPAPAVESSITLAPVAADAPADVPTGVPAVAGSIADSIHSKPARPYASLPDQIGRYGTRVGRAVHGAVQTVPLHDPRHELAERVRQQCVAEEVPDRLHEYVLRLVESILDSELFARMAEAATVSTVRREMYVGAWVQESDDAAGKGAEPDGAVPEGQGIYGIIDAVWMEHGRFVVVDFKTDHVLEEPARLAARYRTQLDAYARALRAATGREVAETLLCVALPDGSPAVTIAVS